ncbi:MAG: DNA polymerase III, subunit gamma and tau [Omnitrophica WOR_2 bacterium RIFCSPHIGHO2_01_FULL_48_9]|nr:MAG: DNA polymerase III, subunit gamma and tau [Omnitrophica WOR_2 bacterium RIFCSPHIGHO2_02_FULL_48_11]OGX32616.1 MAG: DNA polymerase III, subunit gamma and tau [Omnitrophica WOR_2 bacterium RIFCSPHIGHO2_01_FULL_48_9]
MSYLVLARKHRPAVFAEVIGQEHITDLLAQTITSGRIAHAYLFCGPRGIGKTSCARILAKCLNCEKGPTLNPCGQCTACQEIAKGTSFDVLEIDGASNRGIDEIRTLRENVKFAPGYGRYKIYIVDEVHMLTTEAFNALLKTLEEPPEHVKFIFATTDINKVPETIISRCQRFDFKRIPVKTIIQLLADIAKKEKLQIDQEALLAIAKAAQGSLRDALSILDQLSGLSDKNIKGHDVTSMLGTVETQYLFEITDAIAQKNCAVALQTLDKIIDEGKDIKQLSRDLIEHFRNLMVIKIGGKSLGKLVDYPVEIKDMLLQQTERFSLAEILRAIDAFIEAQETSRITESLRMPLEIAFAKLTYSAEAPKTSVPAKPAVSPAAVSAPPAPPVAARKTSPIEVLKNQKGQVDFSAEKEEDAPEENLETELLSAKVEEAGLLDLEKIKKAWDALTYAVSREKMSVATYLQEGVPIEVKHEAGFIRLSIGFSADHIFQKESLESKDTLALVERIFTEKLKTKLRLDYKIVTTAAQSSEAEPFIQAALDTFKGKVVNKWHKE